MNVTIETHRLDGLGSPEQPILCSRCGFVSGDDWSQCGGACPMPGSPYYQQGAEVSRDALAT